MYLPNIDNISQNINLEVLEKNIKFPATKEEIVGVKNKIPDIPDFTKQLIESKLPDGTYNNIDDIKKAIGK